MDIFSIAIGAVGVGVAYFLYLVATRGLPAALAWAKAKWNAGKTELASLQGDVESLGGKVTAIEQGAIAELRSGLAAVRADVEKLKGAGNPPASGAMPDFVKPASAPAAAAGQA